MHHWGSGRYDVLGRKNICQDKAKANTLDGRKESGIRGGHYFHRDQSILKDENRKKSADLLA